MAPCRCRWRNVLICVCSPCICLALLLLYITVMLTLSMHSIASHQPVHFVASGTFSNKTFSPFPKTFWNLHGHEDALWNWLQQSIDRCLNPILRPKTVKRGFKNNMSHESLLMQSFSEVDLDNTEGGNFDELPQQMNDFLRHMQRRNYPILIQPDGVCGAGAKREEKPPLLLLAIKTTEQNFKNREAIRRTWGQTGWVAGHERTRGGGYIRRVFLLGKEDPDKTSAVSSAQLQTESKKYGDILQWNFKDTFFNLTLKDVLLWSWFTRFCNQTRFVFKGDDDVFVNTPKLITYLKHQLKKPKARMTLQDFMVGDVINAALPDRNSKSKYFIPDSFYKGHYPLYAGGGGVVYSGLLTMRLHQMSKRVHLFPIDDVYVGMCMIRLNASPVHHPAFLTFGFPREEEEKPCSYHTILLVHKRSPEQLIELWANMKQTQIQCWDVALRKTSRKNRETFTVW